MHLRAGALVRRHNARRRAEGVCGGLIGAVRFPESIREDLSAGAIGRGLLAPEAASRGTVVREELAGREVWRGGHDYLWLTWTKFRDLAW